jgi:hypothetical protein
MRRHPSLKTSRANPIVLDECATIQPKPGSGTRDCDGHRHRHCNSYGHGYGYGYGYGHGHGVLVFGPVSATAAIGFYGGVYRSELLQNLSGESITDLHGECQDQCHRHVWHLGWP